MYCLVPAYRRWYRLLIFPAFIATWLPLARSMVPRLGLQGLDELELHFFFLFIEFSSYIWEILRKNVNLSSKSNVIFLISEKVDNFIFQIWSLRDSQGYSRYASMFQKFYELDSRFEEIFWEKKKRKFVKRVLGGGATSRRLERTYLAELRRRIEEASMDWLVPDPRAKWKLDVWARDAHEFIFSASPCTFFPPCTRHQFPCIPT